MAATLALRRWAGKGVTAGALVALAGCMQAPGPNRPPLRGSVGLPHDGVLVGGAPLPQKGAGYSLFRDTEVRYGTPRLIALLTGAFAAASVDRPGPLFRVGDLSAPRGGRMTPRHASHRTGRDVDILFPFTALDGSPVETPGFIAVRADGTTAGDRPLRFDVSRAWSLVRALVRDDAGLVQWIFCAKPVRARLLAYAIAAGEDREVLRRAARVLHEPTGAPHDDHFHVRIACDAAEVAAGCVPSGPARSFHSGAPAEVPEAPEEDPAPIAAALMTPLAR